MRSRREFLIGAMGATGVLAGCTNSSSSNSGESTDDSGGRPCEDVEGGCSAESAAQLMEEYIRDDGGFEIEVEVDGNFLSTDDLSATHTTTGGSTTGDGSNSEIVDNMYDVAYWYSAAVNDEFEVGDMSAEIIYSFNTPDTLGTYSIERDWAEQLLSNEWSEDQYYSTVYDTLET